MKVEDQKKFGMFLRLGACLFAAWGGGVAFGAEAAFSLSEVALVWNARTARTKQGADWLSYACGDFVAAADRITGRKPPVYEEGSEPAGLKAVVYFGDTDAARRAGFDPSRCRSRDWRVKTEPGRAFVYATSGMGASYAMTTFVEDFCDSPYLVPEGNDPFVRNPDQTVPVRDVTVRPSIYRVEMFTALHGFGNFLRRRRISFTDEMEGEYRVSDATRLANGVRRQCHTTFCYLRPEEHFKTHPEWYSVREGVRQPMQLCYSNCLRDPEARATLLDRLESYIREDRERFPTNYPTVYDFTQQDADRGEPLCDCELCRATASKYNRVPGGFLEGGAAGLQLELVNALAADVARRHPDVRLRVFAYASTEATPKPGTIRPADNVIVWWCNLFTRRIHFQPMNEGAINLAQARQLDDWLALTPNVSVWDYMLYRDDKRCPEFSLDAISSDLKFYRDRGIGRLFMETERSHPFPQAFHDLNCYLYSLAAYDPDADLEAATRRYCRVYGKGSGKMFDALMRLRRMISSSPVKDTKAFILREFPWRTRENWRELRDLVGAAYALESPGPVRARIALPLSRIEFELARIASRRASAADEFSAALAAYGRLAREYVNGQMRAESRPAAMAEIEKTERSFGIAFKDLPEELRSAGPGKLKGVDYHQFESCGGNNSRTLDDPDSETGRARVWKHALPDASHPGFPIQCGVWDGIERKSVSRSITADDAGFADEKYHWLKIGRVRITPRSRFWMPWDWHLGADLGGFAMEVEGAEDPNWFDAYVSVKVTGPAYVKGSARPNGIWIDRLVLHRAAAPVVKAPSDYTSVFRVWEDTLRNPIAERGLWNALAKHPDAYDEIIFFSQVNHSVRPLDWHRAVAARTAPALRKAEACGLKAGVDVLCTIGFFEDEASPEMADMPMARRIDGRPMTGRLCPSAPETLEYVRNLYGIYAGIRPAYIYIDDDVSMLPCCCPICLAEFHRRNPELVPAGLGPKDLWKLLEAEDRSLRHKVRDAWISFSEDRCDAVFAAVEKSVHSVDPNVNLGVMFCSTGGNGLSADRWARTLRGKNQQAPLRWRPGGGVWDDYSMPGLVDKAYRLSAQTRFLPRDVKYLQAEVENFPYLTLRKSPSFTVFEALFDMAACCTGVAWNLVGANAADAATIEPYHAAVARMRPFGEEMARAFGREPTRGVAFPWSARRLAASARDDAKWVPTAAVPQPNAFAAIGLPVAGDPSAAAVVLLDEAAVDGLSDAELEKTLSGGVLMDAGALAAIDGRGFGKLVGFRCAGKAARDDITRDLDHPLNYAGCSFRDLRVAFGWRKALEKIEKTSDRAVYTSESVSLAGVRSGYAGGVFENDRGGRVAVETMLPFSFCEDRARCEHVKRLMRWLSRDTIGAFVASFHRAAVFDRCGSQYVANLATEPLEGCELAVKGGGERQIRLFDRGKVTDCRAVHPVRREGGYSIYALPVMPVLGCALVTAEK